MDSSLPGSSVHGEPPGKNTWVGCHALLQGIFPTQGSNPGLLHCRQILYHLSHQGNHSLDYTDLGWQSNISAVYVCHSFSSREQASFNFMAAVTICSDFGAPQNKDCHCFHSFPICMPWSDGTRCHDLSFLNIGVWSQLFHSSFTFIKRLFSSSSLSVKRVVSSAYLRLLILLPAILIPVCTSSSLAFHMRYSV